MQTWVYTLDLTTNMYPYIALATPLIQQIPSMPSCVESGHVIAPSFFILGIDFANKGNLVYRLLDCTLPFMDDLLM